MTEGRRGEEPEHTPEADELRDLADLLWEGARGAPPLVQDPVAAMLGLVPDSRRALSADALKRAMQAAELKPSVVAESLSRRGWDVATRDVFTWSSRSGGSVPPALIQAIAEVTSTTADKLTVDHGRSSTHHALRSATASPAFKALSERWARLRGTTLGLGASALEAQLATAVYRGGNPTTEQMLASLEALVSALESQHDEGH